MVSEARGPVIEESSSGVRVWSYGLYDGAVEAACVHPLAPSLLPQNLRAHQQFVGVLIPVFCNHFLQFSHIARHDENKNGVSVLTIKIQNLHLEFDFVLCTITNHQIMK